MRTVYPRNQVDLFATAPADLRAYDYIIVAFSGGKDSVACVLHLLESGVEPHRIELWHHIVDGREGSSLMDWPCTNDYCRQFAAALGLRIYYTWKHYGFEGEMTRADARTQPISFEAPQRDGSVIVITTGGTGGQQSTRMAFPQVSADLSVRWCSAYLKIDNARTALRNQDRFLGAYTLFVSGERAEESPGRARYAKFERDDTDLPSKGRYVDRWRPVHGWSERQVWEIIERHRINPHPAYRLGWGRCSCSGCIFNGANEWATLRLISPAQFLRIAGYEQQFGRTIHRQRTLEERANAGTPFPVAPADVLAAMSERWSEDIILDHWTLPRGAYADNHGPK